MSKCTIIAVVEVVEGAENSGDRQCGIITYIPHLTYVLVSTLDDGHLKDAVRCSLVRIWRPETGLQRGEVSKLTIYVETKRKPAFLSILRRIATINCCSKRGGLGAPNRRTHDREDLDNSVYDKKVSCVLCRRRCRRSDHCSNHCCTISHLGMC